MKRNILLLTIILTVTGFFLAIPMFNLISVYRVTAYVRAYDTLGYERTAIEIANTKELEEIPSEVFLSELENAAIENNLFIFKIEDDANSNLESYTLFLGSNDLYLQDWLLVDGRNHPTLTIEDYYSTVAKKRTQHISSVFPDFQVAVKSLVTSDNKDGYYQIVNLNGNFRENLDRFFDSIKKKYEYIKYYDNSNSVFYDYSSDLDYIGGIFTNLHLIVGITLILMLLLGSKIFSLHRDISIYKIEGESAFSIYFRIFLRYFLLYTAVSLCIVSIFIYIFFLNGIESFLMLLSLFAIRFIELILMEIVWSSLIFIMIRFTPIVNSFKGENKLGIIQDTAFIIKMASIFLLIPLTLSGFRDAKNLIVYSIRHNHVSNELEHYYMLGNQFSSRYFGDTGKENFIKISDTLSNEKQLFFFAKSYMGELADMGTEDSQPFYSVDWNYLINNHYVEGDRLRNDINIFVTKTQPYSIEFLTERAKSMSFSNLKVNIISIDKLPRTFVINDLFTSDVAEDLPLIYVPPTKGYEGAISHYIFWDDNGAKSAQKYLNEVFKKFGYDPAYEVVSLRSNYEKIYLIHIQNLFKKSIIFLILIFSAFMTSRFLIQSDIDKNRQRYLATMCEGVNTYSFATYFVKISSPTVLALVACLVSKRIIGIENILINTIFLVFYELICYIYYQIYKRKAVHI